MDWQDIIKDIEDRLVPHVHLDIWERGLYYYLLRHTRVIGLESATIPLSQIYAALGCSAFQARKTIRSLADKHCIELEQTRQGHFVKVIIPSEMSLPSDAERSLSTTLRH